MLKLCRNYAKNMQKLCNVPGLHNYECIVQNYANYAKIMQIMQVSKNYANYASPTLLMKASHATARVDDSEDDAAGDQRLANLKQTASQATARRSR